MERELSAVEKRLVTVSRLYVQSHWWNEGAEGISIEIVRAFPSPIDMVSVPAAMLLVLQFIPLDKAKEFVDAVQLEFGKEAPRVLDTLRWQLQKLDRIKK
jgi:hypothetical protein